MRIGVQEIVGFRPNASCLSLDDLEPGYSDEPEDEPVDETDQVDASDDHIVDEAAESLPCDEHVFDTDSGSLLIVDLDYAGKLARIRTFNRYDRALQSPAGGDSAFQAVIDELGGPFFGILFAKWTRKNR
jgi:hypothetical protein